MKSFIRRWARTKGPYLAVLALGLIGLVVSYPGDLGAKLRAAAIAFGLVFGASFIPDLRKRKKRPLDEMRAEVDNRAVEELPAAASIDATRPLLVVGRSGEDPVSINMIVIREEREDPILLIPEYRRKRPFELRYFSGFAELRSYLKAHELRVVPQSGLSDELGRTMFGNDWRED